MWYEFSVEDIHTIWVCYNSIDNQFHVSVNTKDKNGDEKCLQYIATNLKEALFLAKVIKGRKNVPIKFTKTKWFRNPAISDKEWWGWTIVNSENDLF